jgi:hypothetical protein
MLLIVPTLLILATREAQAVGITTIVLSGDEAPGGTSPFFTQLVVATANPMTAPVVDVDGRVLFLAGNPNGIWAGDGGPLEKLIAGLDPAPGLDGTMISLVRLYRGGSGWYFFEGAVSPGGFGLPTKVLYSAFDTSFIPVAVEGESAEGTLGVFNQYWPSPESGSGGEYAFVGDLESDVGGVTFANDEGIWAGSEGSLELLLREEDPAPGFDPSAAERCVPTTDGSLADPATPVNDVDLLAVELARDGTLAMEARIEGCSSVPSNRDVLWRRDLGELPRVVVMGGDLLPEPGRQIQDIDRIALSDGTAENDSGVPLRAQLAFVGNASESGGPRGRGAFVITESPEVPGRTPSSEVQTLVFAGDSLPGTPAGALVEDVRADGLTVADTGRAAFFVMFENAPVGDDYGLFAVGGGSPTVALAMAGAPAPDAPGAVFSLSTNFQLEPAFDSNPCGTVAFTMQLRQGVGGVDASNDYGLWRSAPDGPVELIARKGDTIEVEPGDVRTVSDLTFAGAGGNSVGHGGGIGPDGEVAFWAEFTDGTEGIFVSDPLVVECPEPGTISMLVAGGILLVVLARRRDRRFAAKLPLVRESARQSSPL